MGFGADSRKASESVIIRSGFVLSMLSEAASRGSVPMPVASTSPSLRQASEAAQIISSARVYS